VGDVVIFDADGNVRFVSREDDLIKSSEYRIGPEEVEEVLAKRAAPMDVWVIGVADPVRGQNTRAYVLLTPSDALRREPIEFCRGKIALYEAPREVEFVAQLPRAPGSAHPGIGRMLRELAGRS
jgi:2-aminobenzoate-CoA ligase